MKTTMRKILAFAMAAALLAGTLSTVQTAQAASKGYQFRYKGASISIDSEAKPFLQKAGKPLKKQTKKSCAYGGPDRAYQYKDFLLFTYSKSNTGPEYVMQIKFLTKKVKTKEGIRIGSKESEVVSKYGKGYDKIDKEINNAYVYQKGNCKLKISVKSGKVSGVVYMKK